MTDDQVGDLDFRRSTRAWDHRAHDSYSYDHERADRRVDPRLGRIWLFAEATPHVVLHAG
jgi:hypothetical protein